MKTIATLFVFIFASLQVNAQENDGYKKSIKVKLKDAKGLVVIIDNKQYDPDIIDLLDPDKIESVTVLKDKKAKEKYKAPDGVIIIKTKKKGDDLASKADADYPMIILDGKESSRAEIAELDPNSIESIEVIKGEKAIKEYKSPNGVIVIKTKK